MVAGGEVQSPAHRERARAPALESSKTATSLESLSLTHSKVVVTSLIRGVHHSALLIASSLVFNNN